MRGHADRLVNDHKILVVIDDVEAGDRLMLQLQFSNSLFGGFYPKSALPGERTPALQQAIDAHAGIYRNFL